MGLNTPVLFEQQQQKKMDRNDKYKTWILEKLLTLCQHQLSFKFFIFLRYTSHTKIENVYF